MCLLHFLTAHTCGVQIITYSLGIIQDTHTCILKPVFNVVLFVLQAIEKTIFPLSQRNAAASHVSSMISVLIFLLITRRHAEHYSTGGRVRHKTLLNRVKIQSI